MFESSRRRTARPSLAAHACPVAVAPARTAPRTRAPPLLHGNSERVVPLFTPPPSRADPSPHPAAPPLCPNRRQASTEQPRSTRETSLPPLNRAAAPQSLPSLSRTPRTKTEPPRPFPPPNQIRANPFSIPRFASPRAPTHFPGPILPLPRVPAPPHRALHGASSPPTTRARGQLGTSPLFLNRLRCKLPYPSLLLAQCLFGPFTP